MEWSIAREHLLQFKGVEDEFVGAFRGADVEHEAAPVEGGRHEIAEDSEVDCVEVEVGVLGRIGTIGVGPGGLQDKLIDGGAARPAGYRIFGGFVVAGLFGADKPEMVSCIGIESFENERGVGGGASFDGVDQRVGDLPEASEGGLLRHPVRPVVPVGRDRTVDVGLGGQVNAAGGAVRPGQVGQFPVVGRKGVPAVGDAVEHRDGRAPIAVHVEHDETGKLGGGVGRGTAGRNGEQHREGERAQPTVQIKRS